MILYRLSGYRIMGKARSIISTNRLSAEILKIRKDELLALVVDADSYYRPYVKTKKREDGSVKKRAIEPSYEYLKKAQRRIDRKILKPAMTDLPVEIMGGRPKVSVIQNAKYHSRSKGLMKYDVKNFFPSIKYKHVYDIFRYRLGYCEEAANILAKLCTYPSVGDTHVPQGAPTSTSIAIFVLEKMCIRLKEYCDTHDLKFSIWVDDITVSGDPFGLRMCRHDINLIVNSTPFAIHPDKDTGILVKGGKQGHESGRRVTGITIDNNNRLTLGRKKLQYLRKRVKNAKQPSDQLAGSLQFLRTVSPTQGNKLYYEYRTKITRK